MFLEDRKKINKENPEEKTKCWMINRGSQQDTSIYAIKMFPLCVNFVSLIHNPAFVKHKQNESHTIIKLDWMIREKWIEMNSSECTIKLGIGIEDRAECHGIDLTIYGLVISEYKKSTQITSASFRACSSSSKESQTNSEVNNTHVLVYMPTYGTNIRIS